MPEMTNVFCSDCETAAEEEVWFTCVIIQLGCFTECPQGLFHKQFICRVCGYVQRMQITDQDADELIAGGADVQTWGGEIASSPHVEDRISQSELDNCIELLNDERGFRAALRRLMTR